MIFADHWFNKLNPFRSIPFCSRQKTERDIFIKNQSNFMATFYTPYGKACVILRNMAKRRGETISVYDCSVLTPDGIATTPPILLGSKESMSQQKVEQATTCTTPKGRTANRAYNDRIRRHIEFMRYTRKRISERIEGKLPQLAIDQTRKPVLSKSEIVRWLPVITEYGEGTLLKYLDWCDSLGWKADLKDFQFRQYLGKTHDLGNS